jgi:DNA repair exonuclease SbcCD ATPase subunit
MKSAAFNIAFKVHRNEMPFAEGLLGSVEADCQHDFIEALNSLAGEERYDASQIESLINEAQQSQQPSQTPQYDIQALQDELTELKKSRNELVETVKSLEGRINCMHPSVIPGINAVFIFIVGIVIVMILYLLGLTMVGLIGLALMFVGCVFTVVQDMSLLQKQQADIAQKKLRYMNQISETKEQIEQVEEAIEEKKEFLRSVTSGESTSPSAPTPDIDL